MHKLSIILHTQMKSDGLSYQPRTENISLLHWWHNEQIYEKCECIKIQYHIGGSMYGNWIKTVSKPCVKMKLCIEGKTQTLHCQRGRVPWRSPSVGPCVWIPLHDWESTAWECSILEEVVNIPLNLLNQHSWLRLPWHAKMDGVFKSSVCTCLFMLCGEKVLCMCVCQCDTKSECFNVSQDRSTSVYMKEAFTY